MIIVGETQRAGGGVFEVLVDRDTTQYPTEGSHVTAVVGTVNLAEVFAGSGGFCFDDHSANLAQVLGRDGLGAALSDSRVAAFKLRGNRLLIGEECDGVYAVDVTIDELDRLLVFLASCRIAMAATRPSAG